jgi:hypothetical protein
LGEVSDAVIMAYEWKLPCIYEAIIGAIIVVVISVLLCTPRQLGIESTELSMV